MIRRVFLLAPLALALAACQSAFTTSGSWSELSAPPVPTATSHIVTTADGRVVVLGGFQQQTGEPVGQTLVLDPASGRWILAAPIPEPRGGDIAVPLADGTILVAAGAGGSSVQHQLYRSTWIFEPSRDRWLRAGDLHLARTNPSAVRLTDGRVLLAAGSAPPESPPQPTNSGQGVFPNGGQGVFEPVASSEVFDPSRKTWSTAGDLTIPRNGLALVVAPDGGALAVGGCQSQQNQPAISALATAEVFNPLTLRWVPTRPLPEARCSPNAVALADGRILVVGGIVNEPNGFGTSANSVLFDPRSGAWSLAGSAVLSGTFLAGPGGITPPAAPVLLRDGRVFLPAIQTGPTRGHATTTIVGGQLFNAGTGNWAFATSTAVDVASLFGEPTPVPVALPSGRVVVLLDTIALGFDPEGRPPAGQALDNLSLTWLLLGLNGVLLSLLAICLLLGRSRESRAMARL